MRETSSVSLICIKFRTKITHKSNTIDKRRFLLPREMLTVSNRASEDFLAAFDFNYIGPSGHGHSLESLSAYGNKPNAIVRPLQHDAKEPLSKDGLILTDLEAQIIPDTPSGRLELQVNGTRIGGSSPELAKEDFFSRQLDQKLRLFDFSKDSSRHGSTRDELHKKPLFITTVPRGVFLQPTKTLPPLPKKIYTFSSRPKVLESRRQNLLSLDPSQRTSMEAKLDEERPRFRRSYDNKRYFKKKAEEVSMLASGVRGFKIAVKSR